MIKKQITKINLPDSPGVYFFLDKHKKPIYIGKATSLRDRVRSYFAKDLFETRGPLLVKMLGEHKSIDFKQTASVLEALLLEADLIKKFHPIYNTKEKDDKSFLCVVLTSEDFPQLLLVRKKDVENSKIINQNSKVQVKIDQLFGPYTNGNELRAALKIIRKIFPYRDEKCKLNSKRPCFNHFLGLCPGTCIGAIDKKCYAIRVRRIKKLLSGNIDAVVKDLKKDMEELAREQKFEAAKILRDKIYALTHIQDISLIKHENLLTPSDSPLTTAFRIESYDIAHMAGKDMVGVMTVLVDGVPDKSQYRKFIIKSQTGANDIGSLKEIISRRFEHKEWPTPELIVVDGGEAQLNVAKEVVENLSLKIPVVSVVKNEKHKARAILGDFEMAEKYKKEIVFANTEAHRFAIAFHKKKRGKSFLS